ncbi:hypothetical protein FOIG_08914 [Fusarium odoratissimum NRRL 54006]|nr:uncharacterized protein FOIG_08914 [Fusarium odoratissimum NRRL 54006]EXL99009.1 hypothetical protein FOIG_08914 [Fusarium odoratissimum NRRL 54006]TXC00859.1 hypothetical protein FocTR4_00009200 [Fusarium oxysporum f. sp. cubense]
MDSSHVSTDSKQTKLCLIAWIFTGMAIITAMTKLFTTVLMFRRPDWDDLMIVFSLVGSIAASSLVQTSADLGLGRHTAAVASEPGGTQRMVKTKILQVVGYPFNIMAYSLPNAVILILIERLVGKTKTISRRFLRVVVAIQIMLALASVIITFVQCRPTKMLWDQSAQGECWSPHVFNYTSYAVSGFTVFTDLVLAIVPIHAFWKLQLKVQEKLEITFMLGLTFLSAIFTIIKATYLDTFNDRTDPLYNVVTLIVWGLIEQNIVIMAASVPTLRPLLRLIKDKYPMRSAVGYIKSGSGTDPKHNASISEIPLGNVQQKTEQGSEPSWETQSSSEELNGRRATPPFE